MAILNIPQNQIGENFPWREFFTKLALSVKGLIDNTGNTTITLVVPVEGFSYSCLATDTVVVLNPATNLLVGAVTLPSNPTNNQEIVLGLYKTVKAFTISPSTGQSIKGPTTIGLTPTIKYKYNTSSKTWFAIG